MKSFEFIIRPAEIEDAEKIGGPLDEVGVENIYIMRVPGEKTVDQIKALIRQQNTKRSLILVVDSSGDIVGVLGFIEGLFKKISHVVEIGMAIKKRFSELRLRINPVSGSNHLSPQKRILSPGTWGFIYQLSGNIPL